MSIADIIVTVLVIGAIALYIGGFAASGVKVFFTMHDFEVDDNGKITRIIGGGNGKVI